MFVKYKLTTLFNKLLYILVHNNNNNKTHNNLANASDT